MRNSRLRASPEAAGQRNWEQRLAVTSGSTATPAEPTAWTSRPTKKKNKFFWGLAPPGFAHMDGLPLNYQLNRAEARLSRRGTTTDKLSLLTLSAVTPLLGRD